MPQNTEGVIFRQHNAHFSKNTVNCRSNFKRKFRQTFPIVSKKENAYFLFIKRLADTFLKTSVTNRPFVSAIMAKSALFSTYYFRTIKRTKLQRDA